MRNLGFDTVGWSIPTLFKTHRRLWIRLFSSAGETIHLTSLCVQLSQLCEEGRVGKSGLAAQQCMFIHVHTPIHLTHMRARHTQSHTETHVHPPRLYTVTWTPHTPESHTHTCALHESHTYTAPHTVTHTRTHTESYTVIHTPQTLESQHKPQPHWPFTQKYGINQTR